MQVNQILLKPVITEKSMNDVQKGKFTFIVAKEATKIQVREAIEEQFKVNVLGITTNIVKGRSVRAGVKRVEKKQAPFKKAIVLLKEGQKIDLFEVGS